MTQLPNSNETTGVDAEPGSSMLRLHHRASKITHATAGDDEDSSVNLDVTTTESGEGQSANNGQDHANVGLTSLSSIGTRIANSGGQAKKPEPRFPCPTCPLKRYNSEAEVKGHISLVHGLFYALVFQVKGIQQKQRVYLARGQAAYSLRCPSCVATHQSPYSLWTHARKKHNWVGPTDVTKLSASEFDAGCYPGASELRGYLLEGSNNRTTLVGGLDDDDEMLLSPLPSDSSFGSIPSSPTPIRAGTRRGRAVIGMLDDEAPLPKRRKMPSELEPLLEEPSTSNAQLSPVAGGSTSDIEPDDIVMIDPLYTSPSNLPTPSRSHSPPSTSIEQRQAALNEAQTLVAHPLLLQYQFRINKDHRVLLCIDPKCLHAVVPSTISNHLTRTHAYERVPPASISTIQSLAREHDVHETDDIPIPAIDTTPVSGMFLLENGFRCIVDACGLGFRSLQSGKNHWMKNHGSRRTDGHSAQDEIVPSSIQGFFPHRRGYFPARIPPSSEPVSALQAYASCVQLQTTQMNSILPPPMNANETPMMEKITHWYQHLAPYVRTTTQLQQVLDLKKPLPPTDTSWLSSLRDLVTGHMLLVHTFAMGAGLDILVLLKCYASSEKEAFRALSDENTLETYAQTILTFLLMCIRSMKQPLGSYKLPLDSKHCRLLAELHTAIKTKTDMHKSLHRFLVYALGPDEQAHAASEGEKDWDAIVSRVRKGKGKQTEVVSARQFGNDEDDDDFELDRDVPTYALDSRIVSEVDSMGKFNSIIDPFFAILHLATNGKMKQPGLVTQSFAQIAYFSRATTLCEGHYAFENLPESTLYKCVEKAADLLLAPLQANAFNKAQNYTRFISSLVHNTARPAGCRVSEDGDEIQYGRSAMSVISLRLELQSAYEKAESIIKHICKGSEDSWSFPLGIVDDWRESDRGYSFSNTGDWLRTPHPLIQAIMADDANFFSTDENSRLTFDRAKVADLLSNIRDLLLLLAIILFIIPGQPPRAAEFLDHKLINGHKDRTVFLGPNHTVWIVTRRSKTETQTQKEVFVPLALPERLRWIFLTYILVIRPVEVQLCALLHGPERALIQSEFLFAIEGQRISRKTFSALLREWFESGQGVKEMGTRNARHIFTEICRLFIGNAYVEAFRAERDIFAEQQIHAPSTAADIYAVEIDHLAGISSDKLHASKRACMAWWDTLGVLEGSAGRLPLNRQMQRRLDSGHSVYTTVLQPEAGSLDSAAIQAIADLVSKKTVDAILPTIQGLFRAQENRLAEKFQLALANSAALETMANNGLDDLFIAPSTTFTSMSTPNPSTATLVPPGLSLGASHGSIALEKISSAGPTALDFLNRVLKSSAPSFSSISQQKMIEHALQQDSSAVIVPPTGGGKSIAVFTGQNY